MRPSAVPLTLVTALLAGQVSAHGNHGGQKPVAVDPNATWMQRHMAEEHHLDQFDAASFFALHDFNGDGNWDAEEIQRTYGLMDPSNAHVPDDRKAIVSRHVMTLIDSNGDGLVTRDEFVHFIDVEHKTLPDMGTGPGHHGDDEYEYEIHHWEKYHNDDDSIEDLNHPEDIEHFKKHEEMEAEQERLEKLEKQMIVEANIPAKFRRN
ncbi:hypothetical protein VTJ04DRAFT_8661 [Mycothermus thermophilus]|uniref:uncharacterized protein n=1 Tax=Humicola insolens TaxID=85995 RepID=UPI0037445A23